MVYKKYKHKQGQTFAVVVKLIRSLQATVFKKKQNPVCTGTCMHWKLFQQPICKIQQHTMKENTKQTVQVENRGTKKKEKKPKQS